ncbi:MAG: hypothetical protein E7661_03170 [Ruminococcaceae bacterium]|nr:hypothetical protein [Oscillospiraceae bacterium]
MKKQRLIAVVSLLMMAVLCLGLIACNNANEPEGTTAVETTPVTDPATEAPTVPATEAATETPTEMPTEAPTEKATEAPTEAPTEIPTEAPTEIPTEVPTEELTEAPTEVLTEAPTEPETEPETEPSIKDELGLEVNMSDLNTLMQPIFSGTSSVNETVMFLDYGDEKTLLYPIESVVSVTSFDGSKTYEEGKDYEIVDGKLKILEGSAIPCITRAKYYNYPSHPQINITANYEGKNVNIYWGEGKPMNDYQVNVNYTHADAWEGYRQPAELETLQNFVKKLQAGEDVTIVFYGDSITYGASATWLAGYAPYQETYPMMVTMALADLFDYTVHYEKAGLTGTANVPTEDYVAGDRGTITYVNTAVGGWTSQDGVNNLEAYIKNKVAAHGCDLFIVGYGMNDGAITPRQTAKNMEKIANAVLENNAEAGIVFVSTMVPNPNATNGWYGHQDQQEAHLERTAKNFRDDGVACVVSNMTSVSKAVLEHKEFHDYSGNNINHPNDYFVRVYAQTLLQTIIGYENMN